MGESGQIVSFLITPEDIAAEDVENRRLSEILRKNSVYEIQAVPFEMAECVVVIEFPEHILEYHKVNIANIENQ